MSDIDESPKLLFCAAKDFLELHASKLEKFVINDINNYIEKTSKIEYLDNLFNNPNALDIINCISTELSTFGFLGLIDRDNPCEFGRYAIYLGEDIDNTNPDFIIKKSSVGLIVGINHKRVVLFFEDRSLWFGWVNPDQFKILDNLHINASVLLH